jgi:hypothetical protein
VTTQLFGAAVHTQQYTLGPLLHKHRQAVVHVCLLPSSSIVSCCALNESLLQQPLPSFDLTIVPLLMAGYCRLPASPARLLPVLLASLL